MSIILNGFVQCIFTTDSVSSLALGQSLWSLQDNILDDLSCLNVCDTQFYANTETNMGNTDVSVLNLEPK